MKTIEQRVDILFKDINSIYALDFTEGEVLLAKSLIRRTLEEALAEAARAEVLSEKELEDAAREAFRKSDSLKHTEFMEAFMEGAKWAIDQMRKGERK